MDFIDEAALPALAIAQKGRTKPEHRHRTKYACSGPNLAKKFKTLARMSGQFSRGICMTKLSAARTKAAALAILLCALLMPLDAGAQVSSSATLVTETYTESTTELEYEDETSIHGSGYTSVGEAWIRENDYEISYRTGCRISLSAFAGYDWVIVSPDGTHDPDLPSGDTALYLGVEDYHCLFPMNPVESAFTDPVSASYEIPELQGEILNATLAGNLTEVLQWFLPNATEVQYDPLDQNYTVSLPGSSTGFRPNYTTWNSVTGYYNVTTGNVTLDANATVNPHDAANDAIPGPGPLAPAASASGVVVVRIIMPKRYTYDSDGTRWQYYPSDGCNLEHYDAAFASLRAQFPKPSSSVRLSLQRFCVLKARNVDWNPCAPVGGGANYCTRDTETLLDRLDSWSDQWTWMSDGSNELISTVVNSADNNGIAGINGIHSLLAEEANWKPDSPHTSILIHEFGHNFGAGHYPDDGWRKYVCRTWHQHAWNSGHWHVHDSVMNYCHMYWGWKTFDADNRVTVRDTIW